MKKKSPRLTHNRLLACLSYDPKSGNLIWKTSNSNRIKIGDAAGAVLPNGRKYTSIDGEHYMVHRLVWFYHKGEWPRYNIAQNDKDYLNTRIENLYEETPRDTSKKNELRKNNVTGHKNITWDKNKKSYIVFVYAGNKTIYHSSHKEIDEDCLKAAEEAKSGIIPTDIQRQEFHEHKIAKKRLWRKMIKWSNGLNKWESVEHLFKTVGLPPHEESRLIQRDNYELIGPENFVWTVPGHDHRSEEAKLKAKKREENRERYRDGHLKRKFGPEFGHKVYVEKFLEQKGLCAICGNQETATDKNGRVKEFHVDHDHKTGIIRGLLCAACNTAIGSMHENIDRLKSAIKYIEKGNSIESTPKSKQSQFIE